DPVLRQIDDWEPATVAVGVTEPDRTRATRGPTAQKFPIASVTKPLTAYAVLIAVHHGTLHLDEPVDIDEQPATVTVRDLLAHASGLPLEAGGTVRPPETQRIYSNWAYDILGELVAARAGVAFADVVAREVFSPLKMDTSTLDGSPARDATSTVDDLLAFARELLDPTLIDGDLHREATTTAFGGLSGILPGFGRQDPNDWGLGLEIRGTKSPHWLAASVPATSFGHFGQSGSFLVVVPECGVAAVSLADQPFGSWAATAWRTLTGDIITACC
ncbi:MAG: serine hydrolase domain-containing protein, partial [Nitriliruptoraceae bacterium]